MTAREIVEAVEAGDDVEDVARRALRSWFWPLELFVVLVVLALLALLCLAAPTCTGPLECDPDIGEICGCPGCPPLPHDRKIGWRAYA